MLRLREDKGLSWNSCQFRYTLLCDPYYFYTVAPIEPNSGSASKATDWHLHCSMPFRNFAFVIDINHWYMELAWLLGNEFSNTRN